MLTVIGSLLAGSAVGMPSSGRDVTAQGLGGTLDLRDASGRIRRVADFRGDVVLLFFGYTRCPDVCPTTLLRMAEAMRLLRAEEASRVRVLWVTVDPERDTASLVGRYVEAFNPAFIGLRGSVAQTDAVTAAFKFRYEITYYRSEVMVSHSPDGYLIDPRGRTRIRIGYDATPDQIVRDVRFALSGG